MGHQKSIPPENTEEVAAKRIGRHGEIVTLRIVDEVQRARLGGVCVHELERISTYRVMRKLRGKSEPLARCDTRAEADAFVSGIELGIKLTNGAE